MKPTSIIFIFISLAIILSGWLVCNAAEGRAADENIHIFDSVTNESQDAVNTINLGADSVYNKIDLVADSADVYIYGGYSEPYIELINFRTGSYRMTTANRNITVDTTIDLISVVKFWESGFSFRGLRNYFHKDSGEADRAKRINLYIPSDSDINVINVTLGEGNVNFSNFDTSVDVTLKLGAGSAAFTSFKTTSTVSADLQAGNLYFRDAAVGTLEAQMIAGDVTADGFEFGNINIIGSKSNVSMAVRPTCTDFEMSLSARYGGITVLGENRGTEYTAPSQSGKRAIITVSSGSIIITEGEPAAPADTSGTNTSGADTTGTAPDAPQQAG